MRAFLATSTLMEHQRAAVAKLLPGRVGGLFMDMGTGKSRTLLELARIRAPKIDHVVWFCPVSLKETVRQEILKHTDCGADDVHVFGARTCEATLPAAAFHVIGIESMASSARVVLAANRLVTDKSFVAVDESSYIKGHRALRTKRITVIAARARYRAVLTGTPFTQGVVDLFSQMAFLSPKILDYQSFWSFSANHLEFEARKGADGVRRRTDRIVASHNKEVLVAKMAPYVYQVTKEQCLDLPEKVHMDRHCRMTSEQKQWHGQAKEEFLLEAQDEEFQFRPIWLFKLFTALQTIACGFWNRTDPATGEKTLITMDHDRLDLLSSVVAEIPDGEKVIIWTKYRRPLAEIVARLGAEYGPRQVATFDGSLSERQRAANVARWRGPGCRFFVATQSSGGHGLTLNEAAHAVFYADGFKYSERIQAEDRNHRIGQFRKPSYASLQCIGSIDERISEALKAKGDALAMFIGELGRARETGARESILKLIRRL